MRDELEALVAAEGAGEWISFVGQLPHDDLVERYQRAWLVASASLAEGWGLTLTEAAACGTPTVATDIRGHRSSVVDGVTGVLAPLDELGRDPRRVLNDHDLREPARRGGARPGKDAHLGRLRPRRPPCPPRPDLHP